MSVCWIISPNCLCLCEGIDKHADYAAQLEESLEAEKFLATMVTFFF